MAREAGAAQTIPAPTRRGALAGLPALAALAAVPARAGEAVPRLRRGLNLHHPLNWPETVPGAGGVAYAWPPFRDPRHAVADAELAALAGAGFDFLRLTLDPALVMVADEARWEVLGDHVAGLVGRLRRAGFAVVLDLHPVAAYPPLPPERLVGDPETFARYGAAVERVAARLAPLADGGLALEPMNEPRLVAPAEAARWPPMLAALHARVRAVAPRLPLVLSGAGWSEAAALARLDPAPFRGSAVLYAFHHYAPHAFTHQGVARDEARHLAGLAWPVTPDGVRAVAGPALVRAGAAGERADTAAVLDRLAQGSRGHGRAELDAAFDAVEGWASRGGVARERILLGEFGCVAAAHGLAVPGRARWLAAVRRAAEARGFGWALWLHKGFGGMALADAAGRLDPETLAALGLAAGAVP